MLDEFNAWLFFGVLSVAHLSKHCDSVNRFCWDQETTEDDFFEYISTMQRLAGNQLELEVELKKQE